MLASIRKCYFILFYHLKKSLYYLYHTILQYLASQNSIFIKMLFFNLSLLFISNRHFFSDFGMFQFLGFPTVFFFLSLPQPLAPVQHIELHTQTYDTPINLSKPITTHTEPHTHTNTNHQQSHTHKPSINNNGQHTDHHTHHPSHQSANPNHRSKTHTVDLKPTGANPFKKNHHQSHHRSYR